MKKVIEIDVSEYKILENFLDRIQKAIDSKYNKELGGQFSFQMRLGEGKGLSVSSRYPDSESTTYFLTLIRPCLLGGEEIYG